MLAACGGSSAERGDAGVPDAPPDTAVDADEGGGSPVELALAGVRDPMAATLHDATDDTTQVVTVTEDGTFRFPRRLADGHAFTIALGGTQACMGELAGTVAGAMTLAVTCDGVVVIDGIATTDGAIPLRFSPRFDPLIAAYASVAAPLLVDPGDQTTLIGAARYAQVVLQPSQVTWPASGSVAVTATVDHAPFGTRTTTMGLVRALLVEATQSALDGAAGDHLGGIDSINDLGVGGQAIAISGDAMVVGAPGTFLAGSSTGTGAAYVYRRTGTHWTFEAKLAAPVAAASFGGAVAIDGDTIVVGAPRDGAGGAAYVFRRMGTAWPQAAVLRPGDLAAGALFGGSVAIAGPIAAVGASTGNGVAYLFHDDGTAGFSMLQELHGTRANERFGAAVAITATRLAIGAPSANVVYTYSASGGTYVADPSVIASPGTEASSHFGEALALAGDLLVAGSPFEDRGANFNAGVAYVFHAAGTTWTNTDSLVAPVAQAAASFGFAVAIAKHHVVVGAPFQDAGAASAGAAMYFRCTDAGVCPANPEVTVTSPNAIANGHFGTSVALDQLTVVVGAPGETFAATASGGAYVYR